MNTETNQTIAPAVVLASISDLDLAVAVQEALEWNKTGTLSGEKLRGIADRLEAEAGLGEDGLLRDTDTFVCREAARRFALRAQ